MSKIGGITGNSVGAFIGGGTLKRFIPEPKTSSAISFGGVMKTLGSALGSATGAFTGVNPEYADLLQQQIEVQVQMQLVSLQSNLEKSKHETEMAAIRNIRVG